MTDPKAPAAVAEPELNAEVVPQPSEGETTPEPAEGKEAGESGTPELTREQKSILKLERRVDKLTAQKGDLTRAAQQEIADLKAQLDAKKGAEDNDNPKPALTQEEFDRLTTEKAKALRRQETIAAKVEAVLKLGKKVEGFDDATNDLSREIKFVDRHGNPTPFIEAFLESDMPVEVIMYLGENLEEAAEYGGLSGAQIGRRLERLENKLKRSANAKNSAAPKPLTTVKGPTVTAVDETKMSDKEWAAMRIKARLGQ